MLTGVFALGLSTISTLLLPTSIISSGAWLLTVAAWSVTTGFIMVLLIVISAMPLMMMFLVRICSGLHSSSRMRVAWSRMMDTISASEMGSSGASSTLDAKTFDHPPAPSEMVAGYSQGRMPSRVPLYDGLTWE